MGKSQGMGLIVYHHYCLFGLAVRRYL